MLDLFIGRQTRLHDDLEVLPSHRFAEAQDALEGFELVVVGGGSARPVTDATRATYHQTPVREPGDGPWRLDVFRDPWEGEAWICRRDSQMCPPGASLISRTDYGIPHAQPEVALLLFKVNGARAKDEDDFARILPHVSARRRRWLRDALALAHPSHAWIEALEGN